MIIHCPSCSARYPVDAASFAPSGRKVRCAKCGHSWHQSPPAEEAGEAGPRVEGDAAASAVPVRKKVFGEKAQQNAPAPETPAAAASADDGEDIVFAEAETPKPEAPAAKTGKVADIGNRFRAEVRRAASLRRGRMLSVTGWAVLCLFLAVTLGGGWLYRDRIAAFWPASTKLYAAAGDEINLNGLEFRNVTYERQTEGGLPVLAVMGEVVNVAGDDVALPRLRVGLRDEGQKELYHWTFSLPERRLAADEAAPFITRLSSPPPEARDIEVRFVDKTDIASMESPEAQPANAAQEEAAPAAKSEDAPADVPDHAPPAE